MSGFLKSSEIPHHHLAYGAAHSHHSSQLPPGMPMTMPFSLPHGLDGFGQGVWGNYYFQISLFYYSHKCAVCYTFNKQTLHATESLLSKKRYFSLQHKVTS